MKKLKMNEKLMGLNQKRTEAVLEGKKVTDEERRASRNSEIMMLTIMERLVDKLTK